MILKTFARLVLASTIACAAIAGAANAQNLDAIKERKDTYQALLPFAKTGKDFVQGTATFDLEKAKAAYIGMADIAKKLPDLFPDDSKEGGKTEALPVIWEKKDEFNALMAKFENDARTAAEATTDEASFKENWGQVMGNCGTCHKVYRKPSS